MQIRKVLSPTEKATSATTAVKREGKEDEDERILNEMEELTNAMEQKKKRAKKLLAKRQAKVIAHVHESHSALLGSFLKIHIQQIRLS